MLRPRFPIQSTKLLSSMRCCHNDQNELVKPSSLEKSEHDKKLMLQSRSSDGIMVQYWNERAAIRKQKREHRFLNKLDNITDLLRGLQSMRSLPTTLNELYYFLKRRRETAELIEQKFIERRVLVLRADLAAAHFITRRGGSVKFLGKPDWIGIKENKKILPVAYVPGVFIDSIKAEGTGLIYEGLQNLSNLKYLSYLSLKNLETMDDWCMDWVSKEYYTTLKHLDISGCVNVTYRSLSCFYRFECLETLNVKGIPDPPEFKLACLMLLEIMPDLDIQGVDLTIPKKIDEVKHLMGSHKQGQELSQELKS